MGFVCCLASSIVRMILFAFNLIFVICGLALVTVGIIFLVQINSADKIFEGYDLSVAPILFIIIGAAIFLIAFFGCYGAMRQNGCMLKTYSIILCVILVVELVTCYFAFKVLNDSAFKDNVSKELKNYVDSYFKVENNTTRDTVDTIQKFFECCGVDGPADYENVNNNPDKELPRTCCDYAIDSGKKCFMPQVQYKDGCINILTGTIDSITRTLGIFGIIVALILGCGVVFGFCLGCQ